MGWRVPFLISVVLIIVGIVVRSRAAESPLFAEIAERREQTALPVVRLFRFHAPIVILAALTFAGNNAAGYMTTGGFLQNYATDPKGPLQPDRAPVLLAVTASAAVWGLSTWIAGGCRIGSAAHHVPDRLGVPVDHRVPDALAGRHRQPRGTTILS